MAKKCAPKHSEKKESPAMEKKESKATQKAEKKRGKR